MHHLCLTFLFLIWPLPNRNQKFLVTRLGITIIFQPCTFPKTLPLLPACSGIGELHGEPGRQDPQHWQLYRHCPGVRRHNRAPRATQIGKYMVQIKYRSLKKWFYIYYMHWCISHKWYIKSVEICCMFSQLSLYNSTVTSMAEDLQKAQRLEDKDGCFLQWIGHLRDWNQDGLWQWEQEMSWIDCVPRPHSRWLFKSISANQTAFLEINPESAPSHVTKSQGQMWTNLYWCIVSSISHSLFHLDCETDSLWSI